jgi:hypothetical protein
MSMKKVSTRFTVSTFVLVFGLLFAWAVEHRLCASECSRAEWQNDSVNVVAPETQLIAAGDWMEKDEGEQESEGYEESERGVYEDDEELTQEEMEERDENYGSDEWEQKYDAPEPHESWEES